MPDQPAPDPDAPSPIERELWEALDNLLIQLRGRFVDDAEYAKRLHVAAHVRDRLRPLMQPDAPA